MAAEQPRLLPKRTAASIASRKPQRITITLPWSLYQALLEASDAQGRSLSNMAAYWLEQQSEETQRFSA